MFVLIRLRPKWSLSILRRFYGGEIILTEDDDDEWRVSVCQGAPCLVVRSVWVNVHYVFCVECHCVNSLRVRGLSWLRFGVGGGELVWKSPFTIDAAREFKKVLLRTIRPNKVYRSSPFVYCKHPNYSRVHNRHFFTQSGMCFEDT